MSSNEPEYTKGYSNTTVCNYFYYLSVAILALAVVSIVTHGWSLVTVPSKLKAPVVASLIVNVIGLGLSYYLYLFSYLMCSRALLDTNKSS